MEIKISGNMIAVENGDHKFVIVGDEYRAIVNAVEEHRRDEVKNRLKEMIQKGACSHDILTDQDLIDDILGEYETELYEAPKGESEKHMVALDKAIKTCSGAVRKYVLDVEDDIVKDGVAAAQNICCHSIDGVCEADNSRCSGTYKTAAQCLYIHAGS